MGRIALIDADVVTYSCAFAAQKKLYAIDQIVFSNKKEAILEANNLGISTLEINEIFNIAPESHAIYDAKLLLQKITKAVSAEDYKLYLSSESKENTYRYKLDSSYKENRKEQARPHHYQTIRNYLINEWNAEVVDEIEADDALGIAQFEYANGCICTIDKDLDMIPGDHYNWRKDIIYYISPEIAIRNFYLQMLIGDRVDNIKGIDGIGEVKANKLLPYHYSEKQMFDVVYKQYKHQYRSLSELDIFNIFIRNANLLWIQRKLNQKWIPPQL